MMITRRRFISAGGIMVIGTLALPRRGRTAEAIQITMGGEPGGAQVWFRPNGLLIEPGQTLRWTNHDAGNSHTATSYHSRYYGKPRRIPEGAEPWDSGLLLPGESFSVTLSVPGVYDYYCLPHEHAGMVGRIIVGGPEDNGWRADHAADEGLPEIALHGFPSIEAIMKQKVVAS